MPAGILIGFLTGLLGWQINLIAIHRGIARGRGAAFWVGVGAICGDLLWLAAAFAGAKTLLITHREYWGHLKWLGIATIVLAALRILFHKSQDQPEPEGRHNPTQNFLIGFLVVCGNPALLVVWVGVVSLILTHLPGADEPFFHFFFLGGFLAGALLWVGALIFWILPHIRQWTDRRFHILSKFFAAALLAGAIFLIFQKI